MLIVNFSKKLRIKGYVSDLGLYKLKLQNAIVYS